MVCATLLTNVFVKVDGLVNTVMLIVVMESIRMSQMFVLEMVIVNQMELVNVTLDMVVWSVKISSALKKWEMILAIDMDNASNLTLVNVINIILDWNVMCFAVVQ